SALEDSLDQNPPPVMELFVEEGFLGRSGYSYLQWALEVLAWEPSCLAQATSALGRLASLDPGGRYSNRPAGSLRDIFLPWLPQTSASPEDRLAAIDLLVEIEPKVGWKLLLGLLPVDHDTVMPVQRPRWRDWDGPARPLTTDEYENFIAAIQQKALDTARTQDNLWRELVERFTSFRPNFRQQIREALRGLSTQPLLSESVRSGLSDELRKIVARHRQFPSADWALQIKEIDELEEILKATEPANLASRFAWLFESSWPELPRPEIPDYEEQTRAIQVARDNAIVTTVESEGIEAVLRLARSVKLPQEVGRALARVFGGKENAVLPATLGSHEPVIRLFALAFVRQRFLSAGQSWGTEMLARAKEQQWTPDSVIDLCCGLPPGFETWKRVQELGAEMEASYWKRVNIWHLENPAERDGAIEHLLAAGRPGEAVPLTWLAKNEVISSELVAQVLEALALRSPNGEGEGRAPQWYEVKGLFEMLETKQDLDRGRLARLEWLYLDVLKNSNCPPKTLFEFISSDPAFFAVLVSWVFKPDDGTDFDDDLEEEQRSNRRLKTYQLLESWRLIPGLQEDGSIDEIALQSWVETARTHCAQLKRESMGDEMIGKVLAAASKGKDEIWPAEPVRSVLEKVRSRKLEAGFVVGVLNSRGMVARWLGGNEERELERTYRRYADALAFSSPRTASALRGLAESYAAYARSEEHRTALEELEF
ncbi:MAG TPA: hypothetical protein VLV54_04390, partial [Thermoanaerobaculia bacterium]|nr:hypothetical protein [Thermoanaerobaculia bacterium]